MTTDRGERSILTRVLLLVCCLGLPSLMSPGIVIVDWSLVRPVYLWDFIDFIGNSGGAKELARIAVEVVLVATLAAAIGFVVHLRPLRSRPIALRSLLLVMVVALLLAYGTLLFSADLLTLLVVASHGDDLALWQRAAWVSGTVMRVAAVLASLASAWLAVAERAD